MNLRRNPLPIQAIQAILALGVLAGAADAHTPWAKISSTVGGLAPLLAGDSFGMSVVSVGDVDGDGLADFVAGAPNDDDGGTSRGAVYVVFMNANLTVKAQQKISDLAGGFTAILDDNDAFGHSVAALGDFDGDTIPDIVVGAPGDDDGASAAGAVYLVMLNANGTVKTHRKISATSGAFTAILDVADQFGNAVAGVGDFNGDLIPDIAVAAFRDDDGGTDRGCVRMIALNTNGSVKGHQKVSSTAGSFAGPLTDNDRFGVGVTALGDLDLDGVGDLAVGTYLDDTGGTDRGAVWILFMQVTGHVKAQQKIADGVGGFDGLLDDGDNLGISVAAVSDRNADGIQDLVVGTSGDDDGGTNRGCVWVLNLNTNGTIQGNKKISDLVGSFSGVLDDDDLFGRSVAEIPDLDGDGWDELLVGGVNDDDGAADAGAMWVLELRARAEGFTTIRNGSGVNPATFVQLTPPQLGSNWDTTIDIVTPGAVASFIQFAMGGPTQGTFLSGLIHGELLGLPDFPPSLTFVAAGSHRIRFSEDFTLVGLTFTTLGGTFAPGNFQLTNALDITLGTF